MRILIGYNGTDFSRAAVNDLPSAGLPDDCEALVLTVAEICFPTVKAGEAEKIAADGCELVRELMPKWEVGCEAAAGSAVQEIIGKAERFGADLIVLGEVNKRDGRPNMFLGPVAQGLLTKGLHALRIVRPKIAKAPGRPPRLLVGFDGSPGAEAAVLSITSRVWPPGTKVRLLSINTYGVLGAISSLEPEMRATASVVGLTSHWSETLAERSIRQLTDAGLEATIDVRNGQPKRLLVEAADEWDADCIFVAPHCAGDSYERFLLGSVSAAVAAHANCSVEIVRG